MAISALSRLIVKLESITRLCEEEKQAVLNLPVSIRELQADRDIVREGDRPTQSCLIVEGFLCRYRVLPDGTRQIFSFHVPGDVPDLQSLHIDVMDHSLGTIVSSKVAFIPHEALRKLNHRHPRIADMFWRDTLIDAAIFRAWLVGIGRKSAYSRIAHLFAEMFVKLQAVGLTEGTRCIFPLTQTEIGDALGLSTVHVNRSIQKLRADELIALENGHLRIKDWEGLKQAGMFDPIYLHLRDAA
ncbi:MAG: Crp/Fnr family transcriptional regulator [Beijerinckiaceae bacterium]